jgi:hypothetical protein
LGGYRIVPRLGMRYTSTYISRRVIRFIRVTRLSGLWFYEVISCIPCLGIRYTSTRGLLGAPVFRTTKFLTTWRCEYFRIITLFEDAVYVYVHQEGFVRGIQVIINVSSIRVIKSYEEVISHTLGITVYVYITSRGPCFSAKRLLVL